MEEKLVGFSLRKELCRGEAEKALSRMIDGLAKKVKMEINQVILSK